MLALDMAGCWLAEVHPIAPGCPKDHKGIHGQSCHGAKYCSWEKKGPEHGADLRSISPQPGQQFPKGQSWCLECDAGSIISSFPRCCFQPLPTSPSEQYPTQQHSGILFTVCSKLMGSNGVACGSPTPFEGLHPRASLCWLWMLALTIEAQLMVMVQPALPAVSPSHCQQ